MRIVVSCSELGRWPSSWPSVYPPIAMQAAASIPAASSGPAGGCCRIAPILAGHSAYGRFRRRKTFSLSRRKSLDGGLDVRPGAEILPASVADQREGLLEMLAHFEIAAMLTSGRKQARAMRQVVRRFLWACRIDQGTRMSAAAQQITLITAGAVEEYLADLTRTGHAPATVRNHRSALSCFCRFLMRQGLLEANPAGEIRLGRSEQRVPQWLSDDEIVLLLELARSHAIWPEVCLALATGLRVGELARLQWGDIDRRRRTLTVRKSKSHHPRTVPLCRCALLALRMQRQRVPSMEHVFPARQVWRGGWRWVDHPRDGNWWVRALKPMKAAIAKFDTLTGAGRGWYLFRHTFASRAAQAGVSLYKLAQWMGHSDVRTTEIYAHLQAGYDPDIERGAPMPAANRKKKRSQ